MKTIEKTVKVTIKRKDDKITVQNNFGVIWEFARKDNSCTDHSLNGAIADIAGAMLTATIVSHLKELSSTEITYTLTINN